MEMINMNINIKSQYLEPVLDGKTLREIQSAICKKIERKKIEFDAIAIRGQAGV